MKVVEILKLCRESLKLLSKNDSSLNDWQYVELYDDFMSMKHKRMKVRSIAAILSHKYGVGVSTVYKIISRLSRDC